MVQSLEYFVSESHSAKLFPDLLYGIHFRRVRWYVQRCDITRNLESFRLVPTCPIANQQNLILWIGLGKLFQKYVHANRVASGQHQKEMLSRYGFHRAIGIAVLAYVVTWHRWPRLFAAPAPPWLVNTSKACLILKHQSYTSARVRLHVFSGFQHTGFNFFEASHASSSAAFGCFDLGITFRHPCRSSNI